MQNTPASTSDLNGAYGKLLYQNGSASDARKYNSFFGIPLSGSAKDVERTFALYENGLLEQPDSVFTPVGSINSITIDGGTAGIGIFTTAGAPLNIWFEVRGEKRHYPLISATQGWQGELWRILSSGGSFGIIPALVKFGFSGGPSGILSGKVTYVRSSSR